MTPEKKAEVEKGIIRAMSAFGVNSLKPYQSMSLIGLSEMDRSISRNELISVLKSMEGVVFDFERNTTEVRIPTLFFS